MICSSLDIDFIYGDIQVRSCKKYIYETKSQSMCNIFLKESGKNTSMVRALLSAIKLL